MINKITLIGHLGADPEIRTLDSGVMVGRFSLATNDNYKDKDGNWQERTDWHNVIVWRDLAERAQRILKKGSLAFVEGKVSYRKYTAQDGQEKYVTDIVANTFRLLEKRDSSSYEARNFPSDDPRAAAASTSQSQEPAMPADGDDLPF